MAETPDGAGQIGWGRGHVRHGRIPDWVLDAEIGDRAVRLYVVLGRHADEGGSARISKTKLMKRLRCARSTLDVAFADLISIGAVEAFSVEREDGSLAANRYVLHWGDPADSRGGSSGQSGEGSSGQSGGSRAGQNGGKPFESLEPLEGANAPVEVADSAPPRLVLVDGQNLPLNALAEVCGIKSQSRTRMVEAAAALNGKKETARSPGWPGIRAACWLELWEMGDPSLLDRLHAEPEKFEEGLARRIRQKAVLYRERMPGATMSPGALLKYWLDLELLPARRDGGLTPEEVMAMGQT